MKICFIILSLLFIYSIICKNDNSIDIDLDFGGDVAQTIISIEKNITYYAYCASGVEIKHQKKGKYRRRSKNKAKKDKGCYRLFRILNLSVSFPLPYRIFFL